MKDKVWALNYKGRTPMDLSMLQVGTHDKVGTEWFTYPTRRAAIEALAARLKQLLDEDYL